MVAAERRRTSKLRTRNGTRYLTKAPLTVQSIPITCRGSSRWRLSYQGAGRRLQYWSYLVALKTCSDNKFTADILQYGGVQCMQKTEVSSSHVLHIVLTVKKHATGVQRVRTDAIQLLEQFCVGPFSISWVYSADTVKITVGAVTILRERE